MVTKVEAYRVGHVGYKGCGQNGPMQGLVTIRYTRVRCSIARQAQIWYGSGKVALSMESVVR